MESVKFTFDNDFSTETTGGTYSHKMQQVSDDAFNQGKEAGYSEALSSIEKQCELILENVRNHVEIIASRHDQQIADMEKNAASLVLTIIKKLAPALVKENPLQEIEHLVQECLRNNPLEPRLVIRVDEQMLPALQEKIDTIQTVSDYNGQIVLISEPTGNISDCKVEWVDGGAERDFDALMASIEEAVENFINAPVNSQDNETVNPDYPA